MTQDPTMERITEAIALLQSGRREEAKAAFSKIWDDIQPDPDPYHVCTLSHFMADCQDDGLEELEWDLRALSSAEAVDDARVQAHHKSMSIKSFFPSLHLNLGDDYLRLGDLTHAAHHLSAAQAALADLPDTPLGEMIAGGVKRLAERLAAHAPAQAPAGSGTA